MPRKSLEYMLDTLKHGFIVDKEYCKREGICTCYERAYPTVREIRLFEFDMFTPATTDFELWLEEWGFDSFPLGLNPRFIEPHPDMEKSIKRPNFIFRFLLKVFYKIMDTILIKILTGGKPYRWLRNEFPHGTIYRPFKPMFRRFARELPPKYKGIFKYNQRNIVIGKMIEYPVGTMSMEKCKKCGGAHSKH